MNDHQLQVTLERLRRETDALVPSLGFSQRVREAVQRRGSSSTWRALTNLGWRRVAVVASVVMAVSLVVGVLGEPHYDDDVLSELEDLP
ncbi:MAG: hypothetical protein WCI05_09155 [Myxococcales bacterium]|jgi:hypothetical protein